MTGKVKEAFIVHSYSRPRIVAKINSAIPLEGQHWLQGDLGRSLLNEVAANEKAFLLSDKKTGAFFLLPPALANAFLPAQERHAINSSDLTNNRLPGIFRDINEGIYYKIAVRQEDRAVLVSEKAVRSLLGRRYKMPDFPAILSDNEIESDAQSFGLKQVFSHARLGGYKFKARRKADGRLNIAIEDLKR